MGKLKIMLNLYSEGLTNKEKDYMTNFQSKSSHFYSITNIHKGREYATHIG